MRHSTPTSHEALIQGLSSVSPTTEVTLILQGGVEFPCSIDAVSGGLVFVDTVLHKGTILTSAIVGFYVAKP